MKIKNYYKPKLKLIRKLKLINLPSLKILKLKKKKWLNFLYLFKNLYKKTKYNKFKIFDSIKILLNKKNPFELNFKNNFKKLFISSKIFNLFFGKLKKKYYQKLNKMLIKKLKYKKLYNTKIFVLKLLNKRLDFVLFISKFCLSLRSAQKSIILGCVKVNKKIVKLSSFLLKTGDVIKFSSKFYEKNLIYAKKWPLVPVYLLINFKTMEILYLNNFSNGVVNNNFLYSNLKLPKSFKM
jgi:ribosomal protein S4